MISEDICRCHDRHCPDKDTCERWIFRNDGGDWLWRCMSLRDAVTKKCDYYRAVKTKDTNENNTSD